MADEKKPFHNPFGVLGPLRDTLPQVVVPDPAPIHGVTKVKVYPRAVSGKAMALVPIPASPWGGSIEGDSLTLQGDHRNRLPAILGARGVKKIIVA